MSWARPIPTQANPADVNMEKETMYELLERLTTEENISNDVDGLAKVAGILGYHDLLNPYDPGTIMAFLKDNPGAVEAVWDWITEQNVPEWLDAIESRLPALESEESEGE